MAIVNRASLPEEFFDTTSAKMLVQPEPQYLFAWLAKMSLGVSMMLSLPNPMGIAAGRGVPNTGMPADVYQMAARLMLATPDAAATQSIVTVTELGKAPGHTVRLNRPRYGSGGFTLASREILSGTSISTVATDLGSEQVSITLKRYGGPFDAVNSNVAPFAIDRFDASVALHSLANLVGVHMQRDLDKWLDGVISTFLTSGSTTLWPSGFTADNNSAIAGDMPLDGDMLFRAIATLKNANVPFFPNGRYRAVISATQEQQLKADPQVASYIRYDVNALNPITGVQGGNISYLGSISGCDIFQATSLPTSTNANSVAITTATMFGPMMAGQGFGELPNVVASTDDNYGEQAKLIWKTYAGFSLLDARFGVQLHTS